MNKYIVVSNDGWYAKGILEQFPNYQGIDRFPWPLCKEDLKKITYLPDREKACAEHYVKALGEINVIDIYCDEFAYAYQYAKLCNLLNIDADIYISKLCYDTISETQSMIVDDKEYLFIGYDYVLKDAAYSSLIHEKHLCDKIEKLQLNQNGLLSSFYDARRFADLREQAKIENNEVGFESGSDGADFHIMALFKYRGGTIII